MAANNDWDPGFNSGWSANDDAAFETAPVQQPAVNTRFLDEETGPRKAPKGKWHVLLTVLCLVMVGGLSLLMCYLTKDIKNRPIWLMGLIFMVPAGAMFFGALLMEFNTNAMTPQKSRKPQVIIAIIATLATLLVGCLCDAIYLLGGYVRDAGVNYIFAVDRGDTAGWLTSDGRSRGEVLNQSAEEILQKMPAYTDVGVVPFGWEALSKTPLSKADKDFKAQFPSLLSLQDDQGVSFCNALEAALDVDARAQNALPTRILMFTAGNEGAYVVDENGDVTDTVKNLPAYFTKTVSNRDSRAAIIQKLKDADCILYVISPDGQIGSDLMDIVQKTGGLSVSAADSLTIPEFVSVISIDGDMLRAQSTPSKVLTCIMLLLESAVIGVCLSLMLSRVGQKRVQMVLSPLMGLAAFAMVKLLGTTENNPVGLWWLWEGLSFLPLGIVVMRSNKDLPTSQAPAEKGGAAPAPAGNTQPPPADPWGVFTAPAAGTAKPIVSEPAAQPAPNDPWSFSSSDAGQQKKTDAGSDFNW